MVASALALWPGTAMAHHKEPPVAASHEPYWNALLVGVLVLLVVGEGLWAWGRREGSTARLERVWTLAPLGVIFVLLAFIGVSRATAPSGGLQVVTPDTLGADALEVRVKARQFAWSFHYPEGVAASGELHVPMGRPVRLRLVATDALHSFDVPQVGLKTDLPYQVETTVGLRPERTGRYQIVCSALCGKASDEMEAILVVEEPEAYARWLQAKTR